MRWIHRTGFATKPRGGGSGSRASRQKQRRRDVARGVFPPREHGEGGEHVIVRGSVPSAGPVQGSGRPGGGSQDGSPGEARAGPEQREGSRPADGGTAPGQVVRGSRQGEVVRRGRGEVLEGAARERPAQ